MRDELLNETIFYDLDHARSTLARWAAAYNQKRPHSALGYLTPAEFAGTFTATGDRLCNPDQLRRSPVAPPALLRQSQPQTLAPNGWMSGVTANSTIGYLSPVEFERKLGLA
jgi:putative transposase